LKNHPKGDFFAKEVKNIYLQNQQFPLLAGIADVMKIILFN